MKTAKSHDWISEVIDDLELYSMENGLFDLARALREAGTYSPRRSGVRLHVVDRGQPENGNTSGPLAFGLTTRPGPTE